MDICIYSESQFECTGTFGADGARHTIRQNYGDRRDDLSDVAIRVMALSVPGAAPLTDLNICLSPDGVDDVACTGDHDFVSGVPFRSPYGRGRHQNVNSLGGTVQAYYKPTMMPANRINICIFAEGQPTCTGDITADGKYHDSIAINGDGHDNISAFAIQFTTLNQ